MNSELYDVKTGPDGEPILDIPMIGKEEVERRMRIKSTREILNAAGSFHEKTAPREDATIEVAPGIEVSERQIKLAVEATTNPCAAIEIDRKYAAREKTREEVQKDIDISKEVINSMNERRREPVNPQEKYVSFDAMPTPLQRVVTAFAAASEANKELDAALAELKKLSLPPTS